MGNALKFTLAGKLRVSMEFDPMNAELTTSVEDTGIGIKREDLSKLFKFFGTVSKSQSFNRGGMGLGLTISKMIVE